MTVTVKDHVTSVIEEHISDDPDRYDEAFREMVETFPEDLWEEAQTKFEEEGAVVLQSDEILEHTILRLDVVADEERGEVAVWPMLAPNLAGFDTVEGFETEE